MKDVILFILGGWGLAVLWIVFASCRVAGEYDEDMGYK